MSQERRVRYAADYRALAGWPSAPAQPADLGTTGKALPYVLGVSHETDLSGGERRQPMQVPWLARLQAPEQQATVAEIAIRLADEGVPLRAIARACRIPSSELRAQLEAAHKDGRIVDLPKEDWPPYDVRSRRTVAEDRDQQAITLRALTGATKAEASLLLDLLLAGSLCRARYPSPGAIDVHAHYLRKKLAPHRITVTSVHGYGYRLSPGDRERLQSMIEQARAA